ncbi:MAG: hypothetical protein ACYC4H_05265 [Desulfocucumaceae bacterium]
MFRLGLRKEEKEMITRTISELQELRAELSVFKNALAGIIPAERTPESPETLDYPEGLPWEEPGAPDGEGAAGTPCQTEAEADAGQTGGDEHDPEAGLLDGGPCEKAGDETAARRDWAVASFIQEKKPWWKIWGSGKREVRRSV